MAFKKKVSRKEVPMQTSGDLAELTQLRQRVKDLEKQLSRHHVEQHLQSMVLEQIQEMVTITDLRGIITYVNQAQAQKLQRAKEDLVGKPVATYGHDLEKGVSQREIIEKTLSQGQWHGEVVNFDINNQPILINCRTTLIHNEDGLPVGMCGIGTDITQRRQAEDKLKESEAALKAILNASTETISLTDSHGTILIANEALVRKLQKPLEEIVGCNVYELFPPDIAARRMTNIQQVIETGKPLSFLDQREPFIFESHFFPVVDETGHVSRVAIFAMDITRRTQAEKALQQSQSLLNATQELTHVGGWEWDVVSQTIIWTDETYRIHGFSPDELPPGSPEHIRHSLSCYNPEDRQVVREAFRRCAEQGQAYDLQFPFTAADGRRLWIRTMARPIWDQERIVKVIGNIVDITQHKQDEEALQESEERFRRLLQNIPSVAVQGYGPDGTTQYWNQASERLYGYSAQEAVGRNLLDLIIPPEMRADVAQAIQQMAETGQPIPASELSLMRRDGSRVSVFSSHAIVKIPGRTQELFCLDIDITELKQAEAKLKESVARFKALFNASSDSVLLIEPDGTILDLNKNAAQRRDRDTDTMLGQSLFDFLPPDAATIRRNAIEQILNERRLVQYNEARDGKYYRIRLYPVFDDLGKVSQVASFSRDITESKRAEEELRESEEKYRTLFENAGDAIFVHNDKEILGVNQLACEQLGYSHAELMVMSPCAMDTPEHYQYVPERRAKLIAQGHLTFETEHQRKDGSIMRSEVTSRLVSWKGQPAIMSICRDITERKQAEQEHAKLEAQNRQLQKAESLGVMAGAIAHQFNNQLGVVLGNLEMALEDLPRDAALVKSLTAAMQGARKAAKVSGQMLTYLGQTTGMRAPLDLSETCRQSLTLLQAAVPKNLMIKIDLPATGPTISANANQIQQLLTNLVTNAWEAIGDRQGTINLSVKMVSVADISRAHRFPIDWQAQNTTYACLKVMDTGCGIEDKAIDKIFDPFFSTKFTGRGLGLPVVLGIVKAHGGAVTVESDRGQGSSFRVFLPVSAEDFPRQSGKTAQPLEREGSGTVLLVDDEEILRDMAAIMLTRLGYTVLAAKDGVEAVEMFTQHQDEVGCVVSDLTMPRMDGWQTLAALRRLSPSLPVILSSGYDEAQVLIGDHPERPQAFLHKPYQMVELQEVLMKAMKRD